MHNNIAYHHFAAKYRHKKWITRSINEVVSFLCARRWLNPTLNWKIHFVLQSWVINTSFFIGRISFIRSFLKLLMTLDSLNRHRYYSKIVRHLGIKSWSTSISFPGPLLDICPPVRKKKVCNSNLTFPRAKWSIVLWAKRNRPWNRGWKYLAVLYGIFWSSMGRIL